MKIRIFRGGHYTTDYPKRFEILTERNEAAMSIEVRRSDRKIRTYCVDETPIYLQRVWGILIILKHPKEPMVLELHEARRIVNEAGKRVFDEAFELLN